MGGQLEGIRPHLPLDRSVPRARARTLASASTSTSASVLPVGVGVGVGVGALLPPASVGGNVDLVPLVRPVRAPVEPQKVRQAHEAEEADHHHGRQDGAGRPVRREQVPVPPLPDRCGGPDPAVVEVGRPQGQRHQPSRQGRGQPQEEGEEADHCPPGQAQRHLPGGEGGRRPPGVDGAEAEPVGAELAPAPAAGDFEPRLEAVLVDEADRSGALAGREERPAGGRWIWGVGYAGRGRREGTGERQGKERRRWEGAAPTGAPTGRHMPCTHTLLLVVHGLQPTRANGWKSSSPWTHPSSGSAGPRQTLHSSSSNGGVSCGCRGGCSSSFAAAGNGAGLASSMALAPVSCVVLWFMYVSQVTPRSGEKFPKHQARSKHGAKERILARVCILRSY